MSRLDDADYTALTAMRVDAPGGSPRRLPTAPGGSG